MKEQMMSAPLRVPGRLVRALALSALVALIPGELWPQQVQLGRQKDLSREKIEEVRSRILEHEGRAIIGFKPVQATQGMRADGTPALAVSAVSSLAASLAPFGVRVDRQFGVIPAVAVSMDPDRLEELLANPNLDYVEPDYLNELIGHVPDGAVQSTQVTPWGIERTNAPTVWGITRGAGVRIGIIDTGIDEDHPDLSPVDGINIVTGGTTRDDWNDSSPLCPTHGTHVSGTAAALDNTVQVVGVAPLAQLFAVRVFDKIAAGLSACLALDSHTIGGIEWAISSGMDVVNMSLGSTIPSLAEADAIFAAYSAGVVVVAAAGNDDGGPVRFPAAYPQAIAVAATNSLDGVASFSNQGSEIELAAPGLSIASTVGGGGPPQAWNGTSMATPHVAGTAALLRAARPDLSVDELRQVLRGTAVDIATFGFDPESGWGLIDAGAAVNAVATTNLALAAIPGDISVSVEPDAVPVTAAVEVRNVGANGTISWTVADDQDWIGVNPTAGSASDVTPGVFDVTVDPAGLTLGVYTGFVTVTGDAANSPVQVRVRVAVAENVPLDAGVTTQGVLPLGERLRYVLDGTAGQSIDVALLRDLGHPQPLEDPYLRIFMPDGETLLDFNDDARIAGLERQSLLYSVVLPEDGKYVIEVGAWEDASEGGFLLKARPAGPILGFDLRAIGGRAEQNGNPATAQVLVVNLSGVGAANWTATSPQPWISADPGSATAAPPAGRMAASFGYDATLQDRRVNLPRRERRARAAGATPSVGKSEGPGIEQLVLPTEGKAGPSSGAAALQSTLVTVTMDPTGLGLGGNVGVVNFTLDDGWLTASVTVAFWVYSPGMAIVGEDLVGPWGAATDSRTDRAIVATGDASGSLLPAAETGVGAAVATGFDPFPSDVALAGNGDWLVASAALGNTSITRIARVGGQSSFAVLPDNAFWLTTGPDGEVYATACFDDQTYRLNPDGTGIASFGPSLPCPLGLDYRTQDNSMYIASSPSDQLLRVDLGDGSTSQVGSGLIPWDVAIGRSGKIYVTGLDADLLGGYIWVIDPAVSPDAELFAFAPSPTDLLGIALVEGGVVLTASAEGFGEVYFFPVDDGPRIGGEGDLFARLAVEQVDGLLGEPFEVPLILDMAGSTREATDFTASLGWNPSALEFVEIAEGDFGGSFTADIDQAAAGIVGATASRTIGLSGGIRTLFNVTFNLDASVGPGDQVDLTVTVDELLGPFGLDLRSVLTVQPGSLCVSSWLWGDVDRDGTVGTGDATQILRHLVGLPLAVGADIELGDVNRDGVVNGVDAVQILRHLVELPIPAESGVAGYGVRACP
ncbi:MAG: S8 family serine peptidase [Gemmatimonadota bacterium]|nr:MAG: S8 family serine peptidase [Gemmatimonadota bacterium]